MSVLQLKHPEGRRETGTIVDPIVGSRCECGSGSALELHWRDDKLPVAFFCRCVLLPAIRNTGARVIAMHNLSAHYFPQKVMWSYFDQSTHQISVPLNGFFLFCPSAFLKSHDFQIDEANLQIAIDTGLAMIGPPYITSFFADAHFLVPGRVFRPYNGNS